MLICVTNLAFRKLLMLMSDILSSVSILVGILTALLALFYSEIQNFLELTPERLRANNKVNFTNGKRIRNTRLHPLASSSIILTLVFIPELINQISNMVSVFEYNQYRICWEQYSTVNAAFITVAFFLICLTLRICITTFRFYFHLHKFSPD